MIHLKEYANEHLNLIKERMEKRKQTCCPLYILIDKHDNSCKKIKHLIKQNDIRPLEL